MVGGAERLQVAPGVQLIDSGYMPEEWKPISLAHRDALDVLKSSDLDWTSLPRRDSSSQGSAPVNSVSGRTDSSPMRRVKAEFPWRITPSRWSMNRRVTHIRASAFSAGY
jgi:hypothetical protein